MPNCEDSLLLYHIVSAVYLTLKVENRAAKLEFRTFQAQVCHLPAYKALLRHLRTRSEKWNDDVYPVIEKEILSKALRFKTNFVSPAQLVFLLTCGFK